MATPKIDRKPSTRGQEWSKIGRSAELNLEFFQAFYTTHAYPRHVHDYYVISLIERGIQSFTCHGTKHITPPGGLILLNPDDVHTGEPADERGFEYRALYPTVAHMRAALAQFTGRQQDIPFFSTAPIDRPMLSGSVRALHRSLFEEASPLERESRFIWVLAQLIKDHADTRPLERAIGHEPRVIRQARDYIDAHFARGVTLTEVASYVGLSPYYFLRVFRAEVGMPPHAYLESVRIRQAQQLLAQGMPVAEIAHEAGFSSQSHFTHRFKRLIGVTPGQYTHQLKR